VAAGREVEVRRVADIAKDARTQLAGMAQRGRQVVRDRVWPTTARASPATQSGTLCGPRCFLLAGEAGLPPPRRPRHAGSPSSLPDGRRAPSAPARSPNCSPGAEIFDARPLDSPGPAQTGQVLSGGHPAGLGPRAERAAQAARCREGDPLAEGAQSMLRLRLRRLGSLQAAKAKPKPKHSLGEGLRQTLRETPSGGMSVGDSFRRTLMLGLTLHGSSVRGANLASTAGTSGQPAKLGLWRSFARLPRMGCRAALVRI
jgi:hypothetical protein